MRHEIHCHGDFFEVKIHADAERSGFAKLIDELLGHEKWKPGSAFLVNQAELNARPLTVGDLYFIAELCKIWRTQFGQARCAILVARDLEFGLTRMWEVFVEGNWDATADVFRSRAKAISWLKEV